MAIVLNKSSRTTGVPLAQTPDRRLDALSAILAKAPKATLKLFHTFLPGLYVRTIHMPEGAVVVSKIHKTRHPWFLMAGRVSVRDNDGAWNEFAAPYNGITEPGTRRVVIIREDAVWTTVHATTKTTPEEVEADIISKHDDHLDGEVPLIEEGGTCHLLL